MAQSKNNGGTRRVSTGRSEMPRTTTVRRASVRGDEENVRISRSTPERKSTATTSRAANDKHSPSGHRKTQNIKEKIVRIGEMDYTLLFLVILIVVVGLIMLLSASAPSGKRIYDDSYYYFKRQLVFVVFGFVGMIVVSKLNIDRLIPLIPKAYIVCVVLLILVLIPGIGVEANGSRRWLNIPGIQLQPSELMKPVIAMYIAYLVKMKQVDLKKLGGNLKCVGVIGIVALLLMLETHLSGTLVILGIAVCVMIAGGTPVRPLVIGGICAAVLVVIYLQFDPVRMARITSAFDPFADAQGTGYQISQSIYAIGSGRLFGLGLGESVQKYSNLPEPYNDFIFAIICEELGFFGASIIILLFAALFLQAIRIALKAPDVWSSLTCIGIASQFGIQAVLNMGVAVSLIPNTGVSLPFFSYGGTSIMTLLLEMGILLNVSRKSIK